MWGNSGYEAGVSGENKILVKTYPNRIKRGKLMLFSNLFRIFGIIGK